MRASVKPDRWMLRMRRRPFVVVLWGLGLSACARPPVAPPPSPPPRLGAVIEALSEPGGDFDTDNLISNESAYLQVGDRLEAAGPGGVYIGVGPDQNYSYIARLRPERAFIVDIRRQNMLQHLLFNAFLDRASDPRGYLCLLFARPCGPSPDAGRWELERGLADLERVPPDVPTFEGNLAAALEHIETRLGVRLSAADRAAVRTVYSGFFEGQLNLRFQTHGRPRSFHHPTYRSLLLARSPEGHGSFLASAPDYAFVRDLARRGRLVPVVADFSGPSALRSVGRFLEERGETVRAFYVSNVEFYLFGGGTFDRYVANLRELPVNDRSVFIRACFHYGAEHPARQPGHRSTSVMQRMPRFFALYDAGDYQTYWDVCTQDFVQ